MGSPTQVDMAGLDVVVNSLRVGATTAGATGTELTGSEITLIDGITAGTVTASKAVVVDASKDVGSFRNVTLTGNVTTTGMFVGTPDTRTGAGAVSVTSLITNVVTTAADALTLADGTSGQIKIISMITDGGDGTLTPTNRAGYSTITFNDVGDTVILVFVNGKWAIASNNGATVA